MAKGEVKMDNKTFVKIEQKKEHFLLACEEFDGCTLDVEEMKTDYEFLFQTIKEQQKEIKMLDSLIDEKSNLIEIMAKEIGQLKERLEKVSEGNLIIVGYKPHELNFDEE
jgi:chromosome segregation ATPase